MAVSALYNKNDTSLGVNVCSVERNVGRVDRCAGEVRIVEKPYAGKNTSSHCFLVADAVVFKHFDNIAVIKTV